MFDFLTTRVIGLGIVIVAVVALLARVLSWRRIPKGLSLPPGPPRKPIVGNLSDMPIKQEWVAYSQWAKKYGDLVYLKTFGQSMVVINSADVAYQLFEKRSSIYSDRNDFPMLTGLMGWHWSTPLMHYGEEWRVQRRVIHQKLRPVAVAEYQPIQRNHARELLQRLYETPDKFVEHLHHTAGAIIMKLTYGIEILPKDDPYIDTAEKATMAFTIAGNPGAFLVDMLPILKYVPEWFPGAGFQKKARVWRQYADEMRSKPFEVVKQALKSGTAVPSFTSSLLEELALNGNATPKQEEVIRDTGATLYAAGAETTVTVLHTFFLAMLLYPETQRKAQRELDKVVGSGRLPEFEDRVNLPYVNALFKEVLRWHPIIPLAIPHRVTRDDVFGRYFIPAGSIVAGNAWTLLHDEAIYGPDTDKFIPERFLTPGRKDPIEVFGFGRKICPGRHFADNYLYIAMASILSVFDITHWRDSNGKISPVNCAFQSGFFSHPEPFNCMIIPRSDTARELVLQQSSLDGRVYG